MEDKRFSNDEIADILEGIDFSKIDSELIHINSCPLCVYANTCPDAGKYSAGRDWHIALPEMAGKVIAVDKANLQVPYAEIRNKLITK